MTLPGFESVPGNDAGSFTGAPWRVVLHTTEGTTAEGAIAAYTTNNSWPHFTVDCQARRRIQHVDLNLASRSLLHPPTTETNRANAIQIELVGFAADAPNWAKLDLQWLATDVLAPIRAVCPFALVAARFVSYPSSAGLGAAQRFTTGEWQLFTGICGHEHVPGNDHGDPGAIDTTTILNALGSGDDDPMTDAQVKAITDAIAGERAQLAEELSDIRNELNEVNGVKAILERIAKKLGA